MKYEVFLNVDYRKNFMKKKKKKGFTLIELLAIISILAVILLIAIPAITNVVDKSREKAFKNSVASLYKAAMFTYETSLINNEVYDEIIIDFYEKTNLDKISIKGELPKSGILKIQSNGFIKFESVTDNIYCVSGNNENLIFIKEQCKPYIETNQKHFKINETGQIIFYDGNAGSDIVIPKTIDEIIVTSIASRVFKEKMLTSVVIPDSVITIGTSAFSDNQLTKITIPNSVVEIGSYAFANNKLTSVVIPDSVKRIKSSAFRYNELTNVKIGNNVESIAELVFNENKLTSVVIPDSVTSLGYSAFENNELTSVKIGNNITVIKNSTFKTNFLTNVVIPDSVTSIEANAFQSNALINVEFGNNIQSIAFNAFANNALTSVNIPPSTIDINNSAFDNNIAPSAELISNSAVCSTQTPYMCTDNQSCTDNGGEIASNGVCYKKMDETCFTIDEGVLSAYNRVCGLDIKIPSNVSSIASKVFYYNNLKSVDMSKSPIISIADEAFRKNMLTSVVIPDSVTSIGNSAFRDNLLTNVEIGNSVTTIGTQAFSLNKLTSVIIKSNESNLETRFNTNWTNIGFPSKLMP